MKKLAVILLLISSNHVKANVQLVPLDMELGYWETTTQMDIEAMLGSVPKEQREMMRGMMSSKMKMPVIKQCITQETLNDMEGQMKKSLKSTGSDCDLQVIKSTAQEFSGELTCAGGSATMTINTKVMNSKRIESQIVADMGGMGKNNMKTIGEWKSATCPAGI
jgi:hypothetical protein